MIKQKEEVQEGNKEADLKEGLKKKRVTLHLKPFHRLRVKYDNGRERQAE